MVSEQIEARGIHDPRVLQAMREVHRRGFVPAAPDIPPPLLAQLRDGGRMILPIGQSHDVQELVLVAREGDSFTRRAILPVRFVPFTRDPPPPTEGH